ncbi:MAG: hypothetical protein WC364_04935 [Eubacteriales bacterium]|jgi:hypothetical protein
MSSKLEGFMKAQGINAKNTEKEKPETDFDKMSANDKWALVEKMLRDLGYIN